MYRNNKVTGAWAIVLCVVMLVQLLPINVFASSEAEDLIDDLRTEESVTEEIEISENKKETSGIIEEETKEEAAEKSITEETSAEPEEKGNSEQEKANSELGEESSELGEESSELGEESSELGEESSELGEESSELEEESGQEVFSEEPAMVMALLTSDNGNTYILDDNIDDDIELEAENGDVYTFCGNGNTWEYNITVTLDSGTATIVLDNVNICGTVTVAPEEGATLVIELSGENYVEAALTISAAIHKGTAGSLVFRGNGMLSATGSNKGAAIGGENGESTANIIFESGTIVAEAGLLGAAVGGGFGGDAENIIIQGGSITANSSTGAAIGGGSCGSASGITIEGGVIKAESSGYGAAIGSGKNASSCDSFHITAGTVTASSVDGAAIGCGGLSDGGTTSLSDISISGGKLELSTGKQNPIGDGASTSNAGISVSGGVFDLTSSCTLSFLKTVTRSDLSAASLTASIGIIGKDISVNAGKLTGGSFCFDPTVWTADGYSVSYTDGMWVIEQNGVFAVEGRSYAELQNAIDAITESGTVSLSDNGSITGQLIIPSSKNITLELNGYSLTGNQAEALIKNLGTLTVTAGTIVNVCSESDAGAVLENNATLVLSGTVLKTDGSYGVSVRENSSTTIRDGKIGKIFVADGNSTDTSLLITGGVISGISTDSATFSCEIRGGVFEETPSSEWLSAGTASTYVKRIDGTKAYIVGKSVEQKDYRVIFGLFTFDPSEFVAEGCDVQLLTDGRWLVQNSSTPVVQAKTENGTEVYNSIAAAILLSEGDTELTMLSDDEEKACLYIEEGRKVSLDLAGYTVKVNRSNHYSYCIQNHGNLTISDSSGNNSGVLWTELGTVWNYAVATITGGQLYSNSYTVLFNDEGSDMLITGGKFISEYDGEQSGPSIQVYNRAKSFTMTGGEVNGLFIYTSYNYAEVNLTGYLDTSIETWGTGSEFPYKYSYYGFAEGYTPFQVYVDGKESLLLGKDVTLVCGKITGGIFSFDLSMYRPELLSYGYKMEFVDGTGWVVKDNPSAPVLASVGSKMCHSLSEALYTAQDGETITLLQDVSLTESVSFSRSMVYVTLDLAGYKISGDLEAPLMTVQLGGLTITDTSEDRTGNIQNTGIALQCESSALIIRGGNIISTGSYALYISKFCAASIYAGKLQGASTSVYADTSGSTDLMQFTAYGGSCGKIETSDPEKRVCLYGGLFTDDVSQVVADGCACVAVKKNGTGESAYIVGSEMTVDANGKITSGVFGFDPANYVSNGTKITENEDGTWTVGFVAKIGAVNYASLEAALAAVKDGETITMAADETLTKRLYSASSFTLDLAGKVVDGAGKYGFTLSGSAVTVQDSAAVNEVLNHRTLSTLQSTGCIRNCKADDDGMGGAICYCPSLEDSTLTINKVIICNSEADCGGAIFLQSGTLVLEGGQISDNAATRNGGGVNVSVSGSMVFNSGIVMDNDAQYGAGIYISSGSFTATGGEIKSNTATIDGGGLYASCNINADLLSVCNNTASQHGGGVYLTGVIGTLTSLDTSENTAVYGGGLYISDSTLEFSGADIRANTADYGGGVYIDGESGSSGVALTVKGINPIRNKASYGGGIYLRNAVLDLSTVSYMTTMYNTAEQGGFIYMESGSLTISKGGMYNSATRGGGLVYCASGSLSILYLNDGGLDTSEDGIGDVLYIGGTMDSLSIKNSTFKSSVHLGSVSGEALIKTCTFYEAVTSPDSISKPLFYHARNLYFSREAALASSKALLPTTLDYICTGSGDALWTIGGTAEVAIGENRYDNLSKAIQYAADGDTITLLADIALSSTIAVDGKKLVLDLAGKTISSKLTSAAIYVNEGAALTIEDSSEEQTGIITSESAEVVSNSGNLLICGGSLSAQNTYVTVSCQEGSVTEITGGMLTAGSFSYSKPVIYLNGIIGTTPAKLTISGGILNGKMGCSGSLVEFSVKGGVFNRINPAEVTGDDGICHTTLADDYTIAEINNNEDTAYIVGQNIETENNKVTAGIFCFDPSAWVDEENASISHDGDIWIVHPHLGESDLTKYSVNVNVKYDLSINFYLKLPTDVAETEKDHYTIETNFDGIDTNFELADIDEFDTKDGYKRYRMTVATEYAYLMGEAVSIRVYYDGYLLRSFSYSVAQYFLEGMDSSENELFADFCKAALNYGASAQLYYSGKTYEDWTYPTYTEEDLVNRSFNPANTIDTSTEDVVVPDTEISGEISSVTNRELSLVVSDETTMKLRLTVNDCNSLSEFKQRFSIKISGLDILGYKDEGNHVFSVEFGGLYVGKFSKSYTIQIKSGEENMIIRYAAISYAKILAEAKNGENLFCAFYEYIEAFENYLAVK